MDDFSPLTCVFKSQLPHRHIHIKGGCIKSHNIETQCTVRADHVLPCAQPCFFSSACNFVEALLLVSLPRTFSGVKDVHCAVLASL